MLFPMSGNLDEEETQEYRVPPAPTQPQLAGWPASPRAARPPGMVDKDPAPPNTPGWPGNNPPASAPAHWTSSDAATRAAVHVARERPSAYQASGFVALGAIVLLLFGLVLAVVGAAGLVAGDGLVAWLRQGAAALDVSLPPKQLLNQAIGVMAAVALTVGLLHVLGALGVLAHRNWARWLGATVALLGTLVTTLGLYTAVSANSATVSVPTEALVIAVVVAALYAYSLLALLFGRRPLPAQGS
jgi:hypothetical protein